METDLDTINIIDSFSLPTLKSLYEYTFIKVLGMGSSGLVCHYNRDGMDYAIKFVSTQSIDPIIFQREVDVLYTLNNQRISIPKIYTHGCILGYDIITSMSNLSIDTDDYVVVTPRGTQRKINPYEDYYAIVLQYIEGEDLSVFVKKQYIDDISSYNIACWLFDLLKFLHSFGIIHRDIKPGNIMIAPDMSLYLVDFGFACSHSDPNILCDYDQIGTPITLAPEIWEDKINTKNLMAADVWASGVTLFYVLNQKYPWQIDPDEEKKPGATKILRSKIINEPHPSGRYLHPVTHVINLTLVKSPLLRPPAEKLHQYLTLYPVD